MGYFDNIGVMVNHDYASMLTRALGISMLDWGLSLGMAHLALLDKDHRMLETSSMATLWTLYVLFYGISFLLTQTMSFPRLLLGLNWVFRTLVSMTLLEKSYAFFIFFHCAFLGSLLVLVVVSLLVNQLVDPDTRGFIMGQNLNLVLMATLLFTFWGVSRDCDVDETGAIAGAFFLTYCFSNYLIMFDRGMHQTYSGVKEFDISDHWRMLATMYFNPLPVLKDALCCGRV